MFLLQFFAPLTRWIGISGVAISGVTVAFLFLGLPAPAFAAILKGDLDHYVFVPNRLSDDVAIIDTRIDRVIAKVTVGAMPHQVAVSTEHNKLVTSNMGENTLSVVDLETLQPVARIPLGHEPEHMELSPGGDLLAVGNIGEGTVSLVSLREDRELDRVSGLFEPHNMTFSPDGSLIYVGNLGANFVSVIDVKKAQVTGEIIIGDSQALAARHDHSESQGIINITPTPDGRIGFAAFGDGDKMAVLDLKTQKKITTLSLGDTPWRAYSTADGRYMLVPNNGDQTVSIVSTRAPFKEIARLEGTRGMTGVNTGWFESMAFIIGRGSDEIIMIDLATMRRIGIIAIPGGSPETGVTSADGSKLYVALSGTNEVAVIDTRTGSIITRIKDVGTDPWGAHRVGALNYCH